VFDEVIRDVRVAARLLARRPLFSLVAICSLAIGLAATTAVFSLAHTLLWRARPGVADHARLIDAGRYAGRPGFDNLSYANYRDLRDRARTVSGLAAYRIEPRPASLGDGSSVERIYTQTVSGNFFTVLGARPAAGRLFVDADDRPGAGDALVISHALWQRRFDAARDIAGRGVLLNGRPYTIVGVASEGFTGSSLIAPDAWVPIHAVAPHDHLADRRIVWLMMVGRLAPGASEAAARDDLASIAASIAREHPDTARDFTVALSPSSPVPGFFGPALKVFLTLLAAVCGLVLLVAAINVAGMLLARTMDRRHELAVRAALGAGRGALARQWLIETALLFVAALGVALIVALWLLSWMRAGLPQLPVPLDVTLALDARVIGMSLLVTLGAALLTGLVPAWAASRPDLLPALRESDAPTTPRLRLRSVLVTAQVAGAVLLVVVAGLLLRSLREAREIDPGFSAANVDTVSLDFSLAGLDETRGLALADALVERVAALPQAQSAALARVVPLTGGGLSLGQLEVPGRQETAPGRAREQDADWNVVSPGYFATLEIPLVRGRDFATADRAGASSVAIVNERLARQLWPGVEPLGQVFSVATPDERRTYTVVGVARDSQSRSLGDSPRWQVYVPLAQNYMSETTLLVRHGGASVVPDVRRVLFDLAPTLPVTDAMPLDTVVSIGLFPSRFAASIAGSLGTVGLLLAALGLYGIVAFSVASRTREIGIRLALGASARNVVGLVARQAGLLVGAGLALGMVAALALSSLASNLLYGIGNADPWTYAASAAVFVAVAGLAIAAPARRALRVDPVRALKYE
jgi:predicted permease